MTICSTSVQAVDLPAITEATLNRMRVRGDTLADAVALRLDQLPPQRLLAELRFLAKSEIGDYQEYLDHANTPPAWLDQQRLEHARKVLLAFAHVRQLAWFSGSILRGLSSCIPLPAPLLNQSIIQRLDFNAQLSHALTCEGALTPESPLHEYLLRNRLLQARQRLTLKDNGWNVLEHGEPFSQEYLLLLLLEHSHLTLQAMTDLGAQLSADDNAALQHFWRYVGYLMGIEESVLPTCLDCEALLFGHMRARYLALQDILIAQGRKARHLLMPHALFNLSSDTLAAVSRICLGNGLARQLNLPRQGQRERAVRLYITATRGATFAHYHVPGVAPLSEQINLHLLRRTQGDLSLELDPANLMHRTA